MVIMQPPNPYWQIGKLAYMLFKRIGRGGEVEPEEGSKEPREYPHPPVGAVVYREFGPVEHSGIHVGKGWYVSKARSGEIVRESLGTFLNGRTELWVSASNSGKPRGGKGIAKRANEDVGKHREHGDFGVDDDSYSLLVNNCHIFTSYCVTGDKNMDMSLWEMKSTVKDTAGMSKWIRCGYKKDRGLLWEAIDGWPDVVLR